MQRYLIYLISLAVLVVLGATGVFAQNYKIKQTVTMNGQSMTNTTYVRGSRKRTESGGYMGMGGDVATIEQCDLKRNVKVSDKKKMYVIEPFDTGEATTPAIKPTAFKKTPTTRGGTITYSNNITDTGERKPMYGVTARHVKTSTTMESSPDACNKTNMTIQTDGWYIDLPEFSCPVNFSGAAQQYQESQGGGCQDRMVSHNTGTGKLGFPLSETRTMSMDETSFSQTTETVEFSKQLVDAALLDVPQGYTLASNANDLYSRPDMTAIMNAQREPNTGSPTPSTSAGMSTFTGTKVGVLIPSNRGDSVSISQLQSYLIEKLNGDKVRGVAVSSEAEARSMNLDYLLSSDITKLKQSTAGKLGGMFGKVTGTPTSGTFDAQVEYKLIKLADGKMTLQSKSSTKTETEANAAAQNVLGMEASAVLGAIK